METSEAAIRGFFREAYGRVTAVLGKETRDLELVEEALQEALIVALEKWPTTGVPGNVAGWIYMIARRKLVDALRRESVRQRKYRGLEASQAMFYEDPELARVEEEVLFPDERLSLIFACCHPVLNLEARLALTLHALCGLTTGEIAAAFLIKEAALSRRITRARRKIKDAGVPFRVPAARDLPERLEGVRAVIYLIFNEGYDAHTGSELLRTDLIIEAIRLGRMLVDLMPDDPGARGLLALCLLTDARRPARVDAAGDPILLEDQDRALWDQERIRDGLVELDRARSLFRARKGDDDARLYCLQAEIAALHARAGRAQDTDWKQIAGCYEILLRVRPTPVVRLNHAAAVAMAVGYAEGLALMDAPDLRAALDGYHWYHAARANLLVRLERRDEARAAFQSALDLCGNERERNDLRRRMPE